MSSFNKQLIKLISQARNPVCLTGEELSRLAHISPPSESEDYKATQNPDQLNYADLHRIELKWFKNATSASALSGHTALCRLSKLFPRFQHYTTATDGLFQRSGLPTTELYGNVTSWTCKTNSFMQLSPSGLYLPAKCNDHPNSNIEEGICNNCGGPLRLGLVYYNENQGSADISSAVEAVKSSDFVLIVGLSIKTHPGQTIIAPALAARTPIIEISQAPAIPFTLAFPVQGNPSKLLKDLEKAIIRAQFKYAPRK